MDTNKYTATRKTSTGATVKVTVERGSWDESVNLDGWDTGTIKTHLVDRTEIVLCDASGKAIADGSEIRTMDAGKALYASQYAEAVKAGCVGMIGKAFIKTETRDLILDAIAEADARVSKTAKQIKIETAEANARARAEAWSNSPEGKAEAEAMERHERLLRQMDDPNSDL